MRPVGSPSPSTPIPSLQPPDSSASQTSGIASHSVTQLAAHSDTHTVPDRYTLNNRVITVGSFSPLAQSQDKSLLAAMFKPQGLIEETALPTGGTLYRYKANVPDQANQYNVQANVNSAGQLAHLEGRPAANAEGKPVLSLEFYPRQMHRAGLSGSASQASDNYGFLSKRKFEEGSSRGQGSAEKSTHLRKEIDLVQPMRAAIGNRIQNKMLKHGREWDLETSDSSTAQGISAKNLSALRLALTPLRDYEKRFLDHFLSTRLYATHATRPGALPQREENVSLFSRKKLQEHRIGFPEGNTEAQDIEGYASDDHVFFSLEAGDTPQKPTSRFG